MGKGKRGKRSKGRKRTRPVPLPTEAPAEGRRRNVGPTPEAARRKELVIGTGNPLFSDSQVGQLFVTGAIDQNTFRAACRYAWLNQVLYDKRSLTAVCWDGMRSGGGAEWSENHLIAFRDQLQRASWALDLAGLRIVVDNLVLHDTAPTWTLGTWVTERHVAEARLLRRGLELLRRWYDADLQSGAMAELRGPSLEERRKAREAEPSEPPQPSAEATAIYAPNPVVDADPVTKRAHVRAQLGIAEAGAKKGADEAA